MVQKGVNRRPLSLDLGLLEALDSLSEPMADTARKITAESLHARLPVGEVARFDEQLVSRFHLLHEETGELATPPVFVAFDCMCLPQALDVRAIRRRETVNRSHRPSSLRVTTINVQLFRGIRNTNRAETRESEGRF